MCGLRAQTLRIWRLSLDVNTTSESLQILRVCALSPHMQIVRACWYLAPYQVFISICRNEIWSSQRDNYCSHLWMNIAEDVGNAFMIETNALRASCFVETQVKAFALKLRKHIMKKRIQVRKLYNAAKWNNE